MSITIWEWPCAVSTTSDVHARRHEARPRAPPSRATRRWPRRSAGGRASPCEASRILDRLLDVLDGDEALEAEVLVHDQELLDLVLVQEVARLIERRPHRHGEERVSRHHLADEPLDVDLEAQVAVGQDADEPPFLAAVLGDGHAGDAVLLHQVQRLGNRVGGGERDRVDDHPALGPLHPVHFRRLLLDRQVLVNDPQAAELRHRDGQGRLGDGVHRRAQDGDVQPDAAREAGGDVHLRGQHFRVLRDQQHVVEGEGRGESGAGGGQNRQRVGRHLHAVPRGLVRQPCRDISCTSCRSRRDTDRCGPPSVPRGARS